jgi:beta-lactamase superfamily II metal-dependent hydrolase
MRLRVFFANDGDCLLLTSADGRHVLVDGGRKGSFTEHTRPHLDELAASDERLDLLVVSHIDADHISGVISLLKEVAAWEVHDHQVKEGQNPSFPEPKTPRPPKILGLWHNSWRAQMKDLEGPISAFASRVSEALELATETVEDQGEAARLALESVGDLAESIADGVTLLRLVDDETPIPRNDAFGKGLVLLRDPVHVEQVGTTKLRVIGPAEHHLKRLRDEWRDWLERQPASTRRGATGRTGTRGTGEESSASTLPMSPPAARTVVRELAASAAAAAAAADATDAAPAIIEKTRPSAVTPPNRASITLLAEEDGRTVLLTGDAAEEEILEGLEAAGCFVNGRPFWCNAVKVQHHGSEHNLSKVFASRVLAEHYVFCADGAHGNPNPSVVKTLLETRLTDARPFTVWFNCSAERTIPQRRKAMHAALKEAHRLEARHTGQLTVRVLDDDQPFFDIEV